MAKIFVVTGEASGDLLSAALINNLKGIFPDLSVQAWGGHHLAASGAVIKQDIRATAFMGVWSVIKNRKQIKANFQLCQEQIRAFDPDCIIFVDYAGFNIRMAKWAKAHQFKTVYFIPPKLWAWNARRVKSLKAYFDEIITIFPFEKAFYQKLDLKVNYIRNPLLDILQDYDFDSAFRRMHNMSGYQYNIAIFPGSRKQEISMLKAELLRAISAFPNIQFLIAKAPNLDTLEYTTFEGIDRVKLIENQNYDLLHHCDFAWVASGTASLEAALIGTQHIVIYKTHWLFYRLAKWIVKLDYISLPNIILNSKAVVELLQQDCSAQQIIDHTQAHLDNGNQKQIQDFAVLQQLMSETGQIDDLTDIFYKYLRK